MYRALSEEGWWCTRHPHQAHSPRVTPVTALHSVEFFWRRVLSLKLLAKTIQMTSKHWLIPERRKIHLFSATKWRSEGFLWLAAACALWLSAIAEFWWRPGGLDCPHGTVYDKQPFLYNSVCAVPLDDVIWKCLLPKMSIFFFCERKKESSSYTVVASTHKTCNLKYTLLFSEKLLQLNEILARERGEKGYSSSVAVGIIMVWQSQFKSVSPRGIVREILDENKMFVPFGLEEENRHSTVTTNIIIDGSVRKKCVYQCFGGCWTVLEKMPSQVFICNDDTLTNAVADLQYSLNW